MLPSTGVGASTRLATSPINGSPAALGERPPASAASSPARAAIPRSRSASSSTMPRVREQAAWSAAVASSTGSRAAQGAGRAAGGQPGEAHGQHVLAQQRDQPAHRAGEQSPATVPAHAARVRDAAEQRLGGIGGGGADVHGPPGGGGEGRPVVLDALQARSR